MRYFELLITFVILLLSTFSVLNFVLDFTQDFKYKSTLVKSFFLNRKIVYKITEDKNFNIKENARVYWEIDYLNGTRITNGSTGSPMIYSVRYVEINGRLAKIIIGTW